MNREAILAVADAIERASVEGLGFNMRTFGHGGDGVYFTDHTGHKCGTVACIAGWTGALLCGYSPEELAKAALFFVGARGLEARAASALGLDSGESDSLFRPSMGNWGNITTAQAVICLRNLAATGTVKWVDAMRGIKYYNEKLPEPEIERPVLLSKTPHKVLEFA